MHGINQGNPQSGNLPVEKKNHKWAEGVLPSQHQGEWIASSVHCLPIPGRRKWRLMTVRLTSSISTAFISLAAPNHPITSIKPSHILTTLIVGLKHSKIHQPQPHLIHVLQLLYG
jgi:hypothetical protein